MRTRPLKCARSTDRTPLDLEVRAREGALGGNVYRLGLEAVQFGIQTAIPN